MTTSLVEIGAVARDLGIAPSTLRTWERRYQAVIPHRGSHGQRLYDAEQVVALHRVLAQVRRGTRARAAHHGVASSRPLRTARLRLQPSPSAPQLARRAVDALLDERGSASCACSLRLIASELVNNAVMHGSEQEPIRLEIRLFPDVVELRLHNGGSRLRMRDLRTRRRVGGRGLEIVDALAEGWAIDTGPLGTNVTVRLPLGADAAAARSDDV